jgi:cystathionine beta-lyase
MYDFTTNIPRRGTGNIKYDRRPDLDPFWVADMDFASAPEITEALIRRCQHPVFGYAQAHSGLIDATLAYLLHSKKLHATESDIVWLGGLVPALSLAVRAFCAPGDAIMTCSPSYPPFLNVHHDGRQVDLISLPHTQTEGKWTFDFPAMEAAVTPRTRLFLLSNPQNPLGRVFTKHELESLCVFCDQHDLILVSDEIHCDLVFDEVATPHRCAHSLPEKFHQRIITLLSPSKTYNIAGIGIAYAVITDSSLRRKFTSSRGNTLAEISTFGYYAAEAAYRHGEPWRRELLTYLAANQEFLISYLAENSPQLIVNRNEATYLTWIDCRALGLDHPSLHLEKHSDLFVSDGVAFGHPGHIRWNFACPRSYLEQGLEKLVRGFSA